MTKEEILKQTAKCNISYHVLGETDRSAMPIGNGVLAASVWTEKNGDICFYLSRNDAIVETDRVVKLGMFRIHIRPACFTEGDCLQQLELDKGCIRWESSSAGLRLWIDPEEDLVYLQGHFSGEHKLRADYEYWRREKAPFHSEFFKGCPVEESADVVTIQGNQTLFYHHNAESVVPLVARQQGLEDALSVIPDEVTGRSFGGLSSLEQEGGSFLLKIATASALLPPEDFVQLLRQKLQNAPTAQESRRRTQAFWEEYWTRSYLFVEGDEAVTRDYDASLTPLCQEPMEYTCQEASAITRAYTLTKYMMACCSGGPGPVLYNGMLFNLSPGGKAHFNTSSFASSFTQQPQPYTQSLNPDERSWCVEHLWQNVRHPYHSMLQRGETRSLRQLFRYYRRFHKLDRLRSRRYYNAKGQHNTEMVMSCGLQSPGIYGLDRQGKHPGYAENRHGGAVDISPGLELTDLMLDTADFCQDEDLYREAGEYAFELFSYVETRFPRLDGGIMQIGPINSIETYRDTINPIPIVSGLWRVSHRLLAREDTPHRAYFANYQKKLPPLPQKDGLLLPAERYRPERYNCEIPELYTVYPFRQFSFAGEDRELAIRTYRTRIREFDVDKCFVIGQTPGVGSYSGWQYLGVVAARLGLAEKAAEILQNNCALQNPGTRFPAMWGPIYDAVPDTDHGANILNQLQQMVMQTENGIIYLLPAFPGQWNVRFKLYGDADTVVEGAYTNGTLAYRRLSGSMPVHAIRREHP